ncbi:hypothetical protein T4D_6543 [Trichinella pseudospiralis]|uniref:Uncharacterized protein n=1 Tax=Trichinella pseudospiralis TaxID=6337 RepID=A0A0V1FC25_TRIPS|nr:hypothetical protein T4D_6543 [Trichinella pseudospiralis]
MQNRFNEKYLHIFFNLTYQEKIEFAPTLPCTSYFPFLTLITFGKHLMRNLSTFDYKVFCGYLDAIVNIKLAE